MQNEKTPYRWSLIEWKAAYLLAGIAACEGIWVYCNIIGRAVRFWHYVGFFTPARAGILGWALSLVVAAAFVLYSRHLPSVRQTLFRVSRLKLLGLAVACGASLCEEVIFRKVLLDSFQSRGISVLVQIAASALAFGLAHGIWGLLRGSFRAAIGAISATSILGALLAVVYLASHRVLLPCLVAHFLIDALVEPGLVLGGLRGEMGRAVASPVPV